MDTLGKVVLITGASSGIGAAAAVLFAKHGFSLALHGRNRESLEKVVDQCVQAGLSKDKILLVTAELTSKLEIEKVMRETIKHFKTLHILVNNAGIAKSAPLAAIPMEDFDMIMNVNVKAAVQLTQLAIPYLKENKGTIVNTSSLLSQMTWPMGGGYQMSKAALDMFTKQLALELAPDGVRVNSVNPGFTHTDLIKKSGATEEEYAQAREMIGGLTPLGRMGTAEEAAQMIVFLASDQASYITGSRVVCDGGLGITNPVPVPK